MKAKQMMRCVVIFSLSAVANTAYSSEKDFFMNINFNSITDGIVSSGVMPREVESWYEKISGPIKEAVAKYALSLWVKYRQWVP